MKLATWNVNSLRVRLPQVLSWLDQHEPDILCLQETKLIDADFPEEDVRECGYDVVYTGQKTYNGVATLSKTPISHVKKDLDGQDDRQRRLLASTIGDIRVVNVYVPNGQSVESDKYQYKLDWLASLERLIKAELRQHRYVVLLGDYNIAPQDIDVHDPELWRGKILCSEPEREAFGRLIAVGLKDSFRKFEQKPGSFSWWDYRAVAFRRNRGLRIDHILCSKDLNEKCQACWIDKEPRKLERPSDHAPVVAEFKN